MLLPVIQSVSSKGQLVIPKLIRDTLNIDLGSKVEINVDVNNQSLTVTPLSDNPVKIASGFLKSGSKASLLYKNALKNKYAEIAKNE